MIETITLQQAEEKARNLNDKILAIFFTQEDCPVCGPWLKDIWHPILKDKDNIEAYKVYVEDMIFKPANTPVSYFFMPNRPEYNPITRPGTAPFDVVWKDINRIIELNETQKGIKEVFYD